MQHWSHTGREILQITINQTRNQTLIQNQSISFIGNRKWDTVGALVYTVINIFIIHEFPLSLQCPGYILFGTQQQRQGKQLKMFNCQTRIRWEKKINHKTKQLCQETDRLKHSKSCTTRPGLYGAADNCQREPGVAQLQVWSGGGQAGHASCQEPCTGLRGKDKPPNKLTLWHSGFFFIIITSIFHSFSLLRRRN